MIKVYALDADGCIFHDGFHDSVEKDVIQTNTAFLEKLKADILKDKATAIVTIGSNRQSIPMDYSNARKKDTGSCFTAIELISKELGAEFDNFLMTDLYDNVAPGTTFNEAINYLEPNKTTYSDKFKYNALKEWIYDESKLTLILAQIHKIAAKNKENEIEYNFYDDRTDILDGLSKYLETYPGLLPKNVILKLHRYAGPIDKNGNKIEPLVFDYVEIEGTGEPRNYKLFAKTIAAGTIETTPDLTTLPNNTYSTVKAAGFQLTTHIDAVSKYIPNMVLQEPIPLEEGIFPEETSQDKNPIPLEEGILPEKNTQDKKSGGFLSNLGNLVRRVSSSRKTSPTPAVASTSSSSASSSSDSTTSTLLKRLSLSPKPHSSASTTNVMRRQSDDQLTAIPSFGTAFSDTNLLASIPEEDEGSDNSKDRSLRRKARTGINGVLGRNNPLKRGESSPVTQIPIMTAGLRAQSTVIQRSVGMADDDSMDSTLSSAEM